MLELTLKAPRAQVPWTVAPFQCLHLPNGAEWALFYRTPSGFMLRFPDLVDFELSADGHHATCTPAPNVSATTAEHLYLNQVVPLALSNRGMLVFHASAIEIDGSVIAFLAPSGRGKSTLAASFASTGWSFLTDDALVLERKESGFHAVPGHPSIRLWQDSHERILDSAIEALPAVQYTPKARFVAGPTLDYCSEPKPLRAAYFLGEEASESIRVGRLAAPASLMEWTKHSFLLDVEDKALIGAHFDGITDLANKIPCYALDYPRRYEDLGRVRETLLAHSRSVSLLE